MSYLGFIELFDKTNFLNGMTEHRLTLFMIKNCLVQGRRLLQFFILPSKFPAHRNGNGSKQQGVYFIKNIDGKTISTSSVIDESNSVMAALTNGPDM